MIGLLQRVSRASVSVAGEVVGKIDAGLLVFIGVERDDSDAQATRLLERIFSYRVFSDDAGKMNLGLTETGGGLLLVPQFTLAADTKKGARASFTPAAEPGEGERLFNLLCEQAARQWRDVSFGRFGADMQVELVNDGPVTFWLHVPAKAS